MDGTFVGHGGAKGCAASAPGDTVTMCSWPSLALDAVRPLVMRSRRRPIPIPVGRADNIPLRMSSWLARTSLLSTWGGASVGAVGVRLISRETYPYFAGQSCLRTCANNSAPPAVMAASFKAATERGFPEGVNETMPAGGGELVARAHV